MGIDPDRLDGTIVGVASTWTQTMPCNLNQRELSDAVVAAVDAAGGVGMAFNTIAVSDNQSQGTPGMRASLISREVIADSIELMAHAHDFDALVCLVGCDKTVPAALMALARIDKPAIVLYSGPMRAGRFRGREVSIQDMWEAVGAVERGVMERAELDELERVATPGPGTCAGQFTANTMAIAVDSLGLGLPGDGLIPADEMEAKREAAGRAARAAIALAASGTTARTFITPRSIRNAMAAIAATGGSTNGVLHLLALAREAGLELELRELTDVAAATPVIGNLTPSGTYMGEDLHRVGGTASVLRRAGPLRAHRRRRAEVAGGTLAEATSERAGARRRGAGERLAAAQAQRRALRPLRQPRARRRGRQARRHGAPRHEGPARVFDTERECVRAVRAGEIEPGTVLVVRYEGPAGGPGDARDADAHLVGRRRGPRRGRRARHRRPLLRRHARADGRPRRARGVPRRPARRRPRRRRRHDRHRRRPPRHRCAGRRARAEACGMERSATALHERRVGALRGVGRVGRPTAPF